MPKVSVLIPTYNMSHFLDESIQSVLNQTLEDFELIIFDNASTDNTQEIVKKYLYDQRVHYYKNNSNIGMTRNWNKCLLQAKGLYIKFLNADDKLHKNNLNEMSVVLDTMKNVSLVTSWRELFGDSSLVICQKNDYTIEGKKAISLSLIEGNFIGEPTTVMFRRENLYLGLFNVYLNWLPDWDMWLRQLSIGDLYVIPSVLSYFRIHTGQMTNKLSKVFDTVFEEYYYSKRLYDVHPFEASVDIYEGHRRRAILRIVDSIPGMLKNKESKAIKTTFKIMYSEGYIIYASLRTFKNIIKIVSQKLYRLFSKNK